MAAERRLTRSMLKTSGKIDREDNDTPTKKKYKSYIIKKWKSRETERKPPARLNIKQRKVRRKKTSPSTTELQSATEERRLYQVKRKETINIRLKDEEECSVWSICQLDSGDLLIADCRNPVLKQINGDTYEIRNILKLFDTPYSVCKVNENEAIVALSNKSIQFVSIRERLSSTRILELDHRCLGVCHVADTILITDGSGKNVFVYDLDGNIINKIDGKDIFSWNRFIAKSDDCKSIYVTDMREGLVKMDRKGEVLWKYQEKDADGVCTDGRGNVFVSANDSNHVVLVGPDGHYLSEIVPPSICVPKTSGLCFDKRKSKLFVGGSDCNDIHVYYLI